MTVIVTAFKLAVVILEWTLNGAPSDGSLSVDFPY